MKRRVLTLALMTACSAAFAQSASRDAFLKNQAYNEMMRIVRQMEVLENNFSALSDRVAKLEGGSEARSLKDEIDALKFEVNRLKGQLQAQRKEIVSDIVKKISSVPQQSRSSAAAAPDTTGCEQYTVQAGDTLSLISQAFNTTVRNLKDLNGLKSDNLRVGQKLLVPSQGKTR